MAESADNFLRRFLRRLLAETLLYDEEYGASGNVSLIDERTAQECYVASYLSEEAQYIIEKATDWDSDTADDGVGYALATDAETYRACQTANEAAATLLALAKAHRLMPSFALLFEEPA